MLRISIITLTDTGPVEIDVMVKTGVIDWSRPISDIEVMDGVAEINSSLT